MKVNRCFFCNKMTSTPVHVTELDGDSFQSVDLCVKCAAEYMEAIDPKQLPEPPEPEAVNLDLSHITTPEQLLEVLQVKPKKRYPDKDPCDCGMTLEEFDEYGRFGCANCYDHFHEIVDNIVLPYHNDATEHVGKIPRNRAEHIANRDPQERLKLLKLRYAQAIELEEYEKAAVLHEEIKQLNQELATTSSDQ